MNILVLTTRENFVWTSMQEIIPGIESLWLNFGKRNHQVECLNVDELDIKRDMPKFIQADIMVLTAFNLNIVRAAQLARKVLNLDSVFYVYLHNMATISCWPFHEWGASDLFNERDVFISTCSRDAELIKRTYKELNVLVLPFYVSEEEITSGECNSDSPFVYIGRISEQKNLHTLLVAYSLFLHNSESRPKLIIFGKEDNLGSPNMGTKGDGYLSKLKTFVSELKIVDQVEFRGFVSRDKIYKELDEQDYIFVSASLHSDENFGMAALRSLLSGKRCLLSDWGGHSDYVRYFAENLHLVPVRKSETGPVLHVEELIHGMNVITGKKASKVKTPEYYTPDKILNIIEEDFKIRRKNAKLELTDLALELWKKRNSFNVGSDCVDESPYHRGTRIFDNYNDKNSHIFFQAYGMKSEFLFTPRERETYFLVPWAMIEQGNIVISDPHKGNYSFKIGQGNYLLKSFGEKKCYVSLDFISKLVSLGVALKWGFDIDISRFAGDRCQTSIDILKVKVTNFFEENKLNRPYFADDLMEFGGNNVTEDVVLFGGYFPRFLESGNWPFENIRFWVICQSIKEVLTEIFKIPSKSVSVIPREKLFSVKSTKFPDTLDGLTFVHAGRISAVKNIELLIWTVYQLQKSYNKNVKLQLIGAFDDSTHDYWGVPDNHDYEKHVKHLIDELDWNEKPILCRMVGHDQWIKLLDKDSVFVSLSSYLSEDFAVSVAQAMEAGFPCILSDWGGHRDTESEQVLKIPANLIVPILKQVSLYKLSGLKIAKWILENSPCPEKKLKQKMRFPESLSRSSLDGIRRTFVKKWGATCLHAARGKGWMFAETESGKRFYGKLISVLGNFNDGKYTVLIIKEGIKHFMDIPASVEKFFEDENCPSNYFILTVTELVSKIGIIKLQNTSQLVFTFPRERNEKIYEFAENILGKGNVSQQQRYINES
ncbi:MAG: glycosyltransferase [Bacteriovoracaceae bacterium]|nr:glycosyltransferase [Bacteriovoracaceae bacterium]